MYEVTRRCTTSPQYKLKTSHDVPTMLCDGRATSCNGRAMVVCLNFRCYSRWLHRPFRRHTTTYDGWFLGDRGPSGVNRALSCDIARRRSHQGGGKSHEVLTVFGHAQKLSAILVNVRYLKMIVRCRTTSHDIVRRRGSSYNMCAMVVRRRRTASSRIVQRTPSHDRRTIVVRHCRGRTAIARL